jgi:hypothetical protein
LHERWIQSLELLAIIDMFSWYFEAAGSTVCDAMNYWDSRIRNRLSLWRWRVYNTPKPPVAPPKPFKQTTVGRSSGSGLIRSNIHVDNALPPIIITVIHSGIELSFMGGEFVTF